jgi:hypothetical protein
MGIAGRIVGWIARMMGRTAFGKRVRFNSLEGPAAESLNGATGILAAQVQGVDAPIAVRLDKPIRLEEADVTNVTIVPRHVGYGLDTLALKPIVVIVYLPEENSGRAKETLAIGAVTLIDRAPKG